MSAAVVALIHLDILSALLVARRERCLTGAYPRLGVATRVPSADE
jgi:hypothetical protein